MRRLLLLSLVIFALSACSSSESGVVDPNFEEPDAGDEDAHGIDIGDQDTGEPIIDPLCEDFPPVSFCDGERVVECSDDGVLSEIKSCEHFCQQETDGAHCRCLDDEACSGDQRCIDARCAPDPCVGDGERYCDGDNSLSCGDADAMECEFGCDEGRCLCSDEQPCPDGYECVDEGTAAGTCRVIDCDEGDLWCESDTLVSCTETGVTELEVCDGACVDHGDGDARCGCATAEHCADEMYCDPDGSCQPWECEPSTELCDDEDNAVIVCSDEGTVEFVEACDDLNCHDGVCECDEDSQCADDEYCGTQNTCRAQTCVPSEQSCSGDLLLVCNERGSAQETLRSCPDETQCLDGACACDDDDECAVGETCTDDVCFCESDTLCRDGEECCDVGDECVAQEICDDGVCETLEVCLPECPGGQRCGESGELCCSGDTPVCDPRNLCVPDCSNDGPLCGDDLDICCETGDQCLFGQCKTPGASCDSFLDCDFDEYCEAELGHCLPDDFPDDVQCQEEVDFNPFDVEEMWHWDGVEIDGTDFVHVATTPVVADLNGNGTPEIAFMAYPTDQASNGALIVADGSDGATIYVNHEHALRTRAHLAVADIDGDGNPELVVVNSDNQLGVVDDIANCDDPESDPDGCYLWTRNVGGIGLNQAPSLADVTGDGQPEIIFLHGVFDGLTGEMLANAPSGQASMPVAADITGDGTMEILTAGCAFHYVDGESDLQEVWCNNALPGADTRDTNHRNYIAIGDVAGGDRQGQPEVIWVGRGDVFTLDAGDGETLHEFNLPGANRGGPPVVADFDGDGSSEFGVGGQTCYTVFDLDCLGSDDEDQPGCERPTFPDCTPGVDCVVEPCANVDGGTGDGILWSIEIVDSVTGTGFASAVFDFQGDGRHEVVYGDHCRVFVLDGRTGTPLFTRFASRRANSEMPIVVDADGDGRTNLIYQANSDRFQRDCADPIEDRPDFFPECHESDPPNYCESGNHGVYALRDVHDAWVGTRAIWNQHAYHITNINDDATLPVTWEAPWEQFNTFRANRQGEIPLNAPNPTVHSLSINTLFCPEQITLSFVVENAGTRAIAADMPISIYRTDTDPQEHIDTVTTTAPIFPGQIVPFELQFNTETDALGAELDFRVVANDDGQGGAPEYDCDADTATAELVGVPCGS